MNEFSDGSVLSYIKRNTLLHKLVGTFFGTSLREAPIKFMRTLFGHSPFGGMVWGNFLGKNLLDCGGSNRNR